MALLNQTPTEWFSKRQATVKTATYGSEFSAVCTATEQIMDLRGVFGDNEGAINSSTIPHSILKKRHNALPFHREAVTAGVMHFINVNGKENPSDLLTTKFLPHATFWPFIKVLLFWKGETYSL
jgi:hypothetical protein